MQYVHNLEQAYKLNYHEFTHPKHAKAIVSSNAKNVKKLKNISLEFMKGKIQWHHGLETISACTIFSGHQSKSTMFNSEVYQQFSADALE